MIEAVNILEELQSTSGSNAKLQLLNDHRNNQCLKSILRFIYNPYVRTGISSSKLTKIRTLSKSTTARCDLTEIMAYLTTHTTGSLLGMHKAASFLAYTKDFTNGSLFASFIAEAIITQKLSIGLAVTSLNKVYGNTFIPKIGCILGTLLSDVDPRAIKWPCVATEKLDGVRRLLVKENDVIKMYSRSGHEDTGLVDIIAEAAHLPDNTVYDGELLAMGNHKDCIAQRQATNSIAGSGGVKSGVTFNIFDMIPLDEFKSGASLDSALKRKITLGATFMDHSISHLRDDASILIQAFGLHKELTYIKVVPILGLVSNMDQAIELAMTIWDNDGEGIMLNTCSGLYTLQRTKDLLKVKRTVEHTLKIIGMLEGKGKFENTLGTLVVDYRGTPVGVGSGLTDAQRNSIWKNPGAFIDRFIEVDSFGESTNAAGGVSLNCPIFKRFVQDKE